MSDKLTTKSHLEEAATRLKALIGNLATATTEALEEMAENTSPVDISYDAETETLSFSTTSSQSSESE